MRWVPVVAGAGVIGLAVARREELVGNRVGQATRVEEPRAVRAVEAVQQARRRVAGLEEQEVNARTARRWRGRSANAIPGSEPTA